MTYDDGDYRPWIRPWIQSSSERRDREDDRPIGVGSLGIDPNDYRGGRGDYEGEPTRGDNAYGD